MKKSKLININKSIILKDIYSYDFVTLFYEHENSCDNYANIYAVANNGQNSEYVGYSTNALANDELIKSFLLEKIIKLTKMIFNDFYYEIKQLKNGIKINNKFFRLNIPKINRYALLTGTIIKKTDFSKLASKVNNYLKSLSTKH